MNAPQVAAKTEPMFRAPPEIGEIRVASTNGHVAVIGADYRVLPKSLHRMALGAGAECDQRAVRGEEPAPDVKAAEARADHTEQYRKALQIMMARAEPKDFTEAGLPNLNVVSKLAGMTVHKDEVYAVFNQLEIERDAQAG